MRSNWMEGLFHIPPSGGKPKKKVDKKEPKALSRREERKAELASAEEGDSV